MAKWYANKVVDLFPTIKKASKYIEIDDVTSFTLPEVAFADGEVAGAGIFGTVNIPDPYNIDAMEATITAKSLSVGVIEAINPTGVNLRLNWAVDNINGETDTSYTSYTATLKGRPKSIPEISAEKGNAMEIELTVAVSYYKLSKNGEIIHEIDPLNGKLIINRVDLGKKLKKALNK